MNDQPAPSRILEIPPEQLSPEQRAGLDALLRGRGRVLTPYKVWLHSPELLRTMEQLGTFLNKKCSLSEREVELGICLVARHWASEYVFRIHAARCIALGFPSSIIEAIRHDRVPTCLIRASGPSTKWPPWRRARGLAPTMSSTARWVCWAEMGWPRSSVCSATTARSRSL